MCRIDRLDEPTAEEHAAIVAPLDEFTRQQGFLWKPRPVVLALRDDGGEIAGGLVGNLNWEWLRIEILAVSEDLRGQGWGRRLMLETERLAVEGGCHHAWVDTFSFQSRPFYERLGYRVFGELPDFPTGERRFFLFKDLLRSP